MALNEPFLSNQPRSLKKKKIKKVWNPCKSLRNIEITIAILDMHLFEPQMGIILECMKQLRNRRMIVVCF